MKHNNDSLSAFQNAVSAFFERVRPEILQEGMVLLAQRGWFVTLWDMPLDEVLRCTILIKQGYSYRADESLTRYYNSAMPGLALDILKKYPDRARVIDCALCAHKLSVYELSVPVFLAQADGIGMTEFGISPYSRRKDNIAKLKKFVEEVFKTERCYGTYWHLIYGNLPVHANDEDIGKYDDPLNRHEVLHGRSVNYGTAMNSCKAFAWLQYIASFRDAGWLWTKEPNHRL